MYIFFYLTHFGRHSFITDPFVFIRFYSFFEMFFKSVFCDWVNNVGVDVAWETDVSFYFEFSRSKGSSWIVRRWKLSHVFIRNQKNKWAKTAIDCWSNTVKSKYDFARCQLNNQMTKLLTRHETVWANFVYGKLGVGVTQLDQNTKTVSENLRTLFKLKSRKYP